MTIIQTNPLDSSSSKIGTSTSLQKKETLKPVEPTEIASAPRIKTIKDLVSSASNEVSDPQKIKAGQEIANKSEQELTNELDALAELLSHPAK